MDSDAERYFALQLTLHQISWLKNDGKKFKQGFRYIDLNGKLRTYYPDFFLPELNLWVEIKGNKYIRYDDYLRREAVGIPVITLISNEFKYNLPFFFRMSGASEGNRILITG